MFVTAGEPIGRRARTDGAVRLGALAALWLSLLLVTYWWVAGGGVQELGGWATGLTSLGRLTGLVAAVLLLAQVVLMARVPLLEAAFGQDQLARIHRITGFTSFNLMLAHLVTITWGYAAGELRRTPATLWDLTVDYPGMLLAVGGTLALCLSVLTSIRAARRRLRYESWHLLHLYAYLGVGIALPHQLWTGQEFLASTGRTVFWWTVWALAVVTVLVYRIAVPVWQNARHRLHVTAVVPEANGVVSVYVGGQRLDRLRAEAGQFFAWRFLDRPGWARANPYSLSAAPDGHGLRITVQEAGDGSAALSTLRPGTRVFVEGPYGRMSPRARTQRKIALTGAGVGVTPLRALAEGLEYAPGDALLIQRYTEEPLFHEEFQRLWNDRGLALLTLPGPRRRADSWFGAGVPKYDDLHVLLHWVPDIAERDVYLCGPETWTDLVRSTLTAAGLPAERLHLESFKW
ncbi:ferric reductase-like transmembrane domain-containing protein [Kribbella jejuensis]|uniref:Putative ferric reductase n=1 Tax=Kribbella jejuensis TaxID=236068 RepID=A0A542DSA4_9ACTN|nr:ferredoxin reductase family protein [Kribbella jejuensis]TQJ05972.1 putative ferric reductase [Kribbella jejuensis]